MGVSYELSKRERKLGGPERRKYSSKFEFFLFPSVFSLYIIIHLFWEQLFAIQHSNNENLTAAIKKMID